MSLDIEVIQCDPHGVNGSFCNDEMRKYLQNGPILLGLRDRGDFDLVLVLLEQRRAKDAANVVWL